MVDLIKQIDNFIAKAERVYLKPGETPPKGVQVMQGKKGGRYYEGGLTGRQKQMQIAKKKSPQLENAYAMFMLNDYQDDSDEGSEMVNKRKKFISKLKERGYSEEDIGELAEKVAWASVSPSSGSRGAGYTERIR